MITIDINENEDATSCVELTTEEEMNEYIGIMEKGVTALDNMQSSLNLISLTTESDKQVLDIAVENFNRNLTVLGASEYSIEVESTVELTTEGAMNAIKKAWDAIVKFFAMVWEKITGLFKSKEAEVARIYKADKEIVFRKIYVSDIIIPNTIEESNKGIEHGGDKFRDIIKGIPLCPTLRILNSKKSKKDMIAVRPDKCLQNFEISPKDLKAEDKLSEALLTKHQFAQVSSFKPGKASGNTVQINGLGYGIVTPLFTKELNSGKSGIEGLEHFEKIYQSDITFSMYKICSIGKYNVKYHLPEKLMIMSIGITTDDTHDYIKNRLKYDISIIRERLAPASKKDMDLYEKTLAKYVKLKDITIADMNNILQHIKTSEANKIKVIKGFEETTSLYIKGYKELIAVKEFAAKYNKSKEEKKPE